MAAKANPVFSGPVNATAPHPVTGSQFAKALGRALRRPVFLRVPGFPLKLVLGDMARELLLGGQRVAPAKALKNGFTFKFAELESALHDILS
jgi:NAD dependent epimerase/dehydratase family enzyme